MDFIWQFAIAILATQHVTSQTYGYYCEYKTSSSSRYELDLCHYPTNGLVIEASNSQYQYLYTPANRSFSSPQTQTTYLVVRIDKIDQTNITYFASSISTLPSISTLYSEQTFLFEYTITNPSCPQQTETLNIYWQCNNSVTNYPYYYNILSVGFIYPCMNIIFIQSPFACRQSDWPPILKYDCIFTKNINNQIFTLNLTTFTSDTGAGWPLRFEYYPCQNLPAPTYAEGLQYSMARKYDNSRYPTYGIWDVLNVIEPEYNLEKNIWTFTYHGRNRECEGEYTTVINWNCSCDYQQLFYSTAVDNGENCTVVLDISANSVCVDDECDRNNTDCVYEYEIGENQWVSLNLTELIGNVITVVEDDGTTAFVYNPCNNTIMCDGLETMAARIEITDDECVDYLAIFDDTNGFKVDYQQNDWIISYSNGQICNGNNMQFIVNWKCASNAYVEWNVLNGSFIEECVYMAIIQSKYAC